MSQTVSDYVVARMSEWGVTRVFGYPGDGINGVMGALNRAKDKIAFVQARHEEEAAFMASGYAKFTNEVGVCISTSGPGAIHLLNGLYDAKLDHQPVVAIVGQQASIGLGGSYQQEVDLVSLFKDVAGEYVQQSSNPSQVRHLIDRAFRIAQAERTVTCVILPNDLQEEKYTEPPHEHGTVHSSAGYSKPIMLPTAIDLQKAADILNEGKKVAILIGAGAFTAADEVVEVADLLGAGVAKALLGKAVLPDSLPYVTGTMGLLGTKPSWDMMMGCDTLLMIGSGFPYSEFLPKDGKARGVQIDIDGRMLGIRYPMELNLQGDSKATLQALIPLLQHKEDRSWRDTIEKNVADWKDYLVERTKTTSEFINPQKVFFELSLRLASDAMLLADTGTATIWYALYVNIQKGMNATVSGTLASMGNALPYTLAAKFAYPGRPAVAMVGDGAMQMLGINSLITISKYWKQWSNPTLVIIVVNNRDLNMVTWEQRITEGDPKFEGSQDLPDFDYAGYAKLLGLEGIKVERTEEIAFALDTAFNMQKPVLVEVLTDKNVPPMPPHISFQQANKFMMAIGKGDPDTLEVITQMYKGMIAKLFH